MGWHRAVTHSLHLGLEVCEVLAPSDIEVPVGVLILAHAVGRIRRADAEQGRRCLCRVSSPMSAGRRLDEDVNLSVTQGQNNKQVHIHTTKQKSSDGGIKSTACRSCLACLVILPKVAW